MAPPLPTADRLLDLERRARREGTGLGATDLPGCWWLRQVWGRGRRQPSAASAALLRALGARLEIAPAADADTLRLANTVNLGALQLRFEGEARLRGRRPLLVFWFERLRLRLAGLTLLERTLARPVERRLPFFALIGSGPAAGGEPGWLAARGRSGGLALWVADQERSRSSRS
ncbi:MAG: hypothetical protein VKI81_06955 [Synechococcaceae cyanobacterium]|nr:hypothetical protein [Synechococcaceae cyanobacterium]